MAKPDNNGIYHIMINNDEAQPIILEKDEILVYSTRMDESKLRVQPVDDHFKESKHSYWIGEY